MEPTKISATDVSISANTGRSPDLQIAYTGTEDVTSSFDKIVSSHLTNQQQENIEVQGFKQSELASSPTSNISYWNISEYNSTMQSGILTQNAGKSLIDLTFDPNSPKGAIDVAFFESTSMKSSNDGLNKSLSLITSGGYRRFHVSN